MILFSGKEFALFVLWAWDRPHGHPESYYWCMLCVFLSLLTFTTSFSKGDAYCKSRMALKLDFFVEEELEFKMIGDKKEETVVYPLMYGRGAAPSMDV